MKPLDYKIVKLYSKYLQETITQEESQVLQDWIEKNDPEGHILHYFKKNNAEEAMSYLQSLDANQAFSQFNQKKKSLIFLQRKNRFIKIAACVCILVGGYLLFNHSHQIIKLEEKQEMLVQADIAPGSNKAYLILSDGSQLDLGEESETQIDDQGVSIMTDENGLKYEETKKNSSKIVYNTLVIPKAGTYNLTLSDGTKVWMNSLSELKFPLTFSEKERTVYLKGEAYFEVKSNPNQPFIIKVDENLIKVTGTSLNVNAYSEKMRTTLVEGRAQVTHDLHTFHALKEGYEGILSDDFKLKKANLKKILAWKNSDFYFSKDSIKDILEQISRWYDVEIIEKGTAPQNLTITGNISRDLPLSQVLELLQYTSQIKFNIQDQKLEVIYP